MDRGWGGVQWDRGVDGGGRGMERVEGKRVGAQYSVQVAHTRLI